MQSYSRQRRHQLGLDLLEGRIYERSLGFYPRGKNAPPSSAEKGGCLLKVEEISYRPSTTEVSRIACKGQDSNTWKPWDLLQLTWAQISHGSLNAFGPFFKLKNKTLIFPETKSSGDDNQQGPQASTPQQIAELFNSYFVSVFTAPSSEVRTWSALFTPSHPHTPLWMSWISRWKWLWHLANSLI